MARESKEGGGTPAAGKEPSKEGGMWETRNQGAKRRSRESDQGQQHVLRLARAEEKEQAKDVASTLPVRASTEVAQWLDGGSQSASQSTHHLCVSCFARR